MKKILTQLTFAFCLLLSTSSSAQEVTVSGKISDAEGHAVPYASVYQKGTTRGTAANGNGEYALKMTAGTVELIVKAIGYTQVARPLDLKNDQVLNIVLQPEVYQLKDLVLTRGGEDPANQIIREAIKRRKGYLDEVNGYSCRVYIKGLQKMLAAPKKFLGKNIDELTAGMGLDSNRRGILYLSESESQYSVQNGQKHEEMISSKVSGSNQAFSFNRASDLEVNFYENHQDWEGLTNRPLVSPIADNAFTYYRYKFMGTYTENGELINKIQVIPRRKAEPVFSGFIYITEDSWRIYSAELLLSKDASINFVDTVKVTQTFFPAKGTVWMPSSVRFDFSGGLFGFRIGGNYTAVYRDYVINPTLNKKLFAEVMRVGKGVAKNDSAYWNMVRPIPLTAEEQNDYIKKSALAEKRQSKAYLDSLDAKNNRFKLREFLFGNGYSARNRYKKESFHLSSPLHAAFYNTVEGFGLNYEARFRKVIDSVSSRSFYVGGAARYGFSSKRFLGMLSTGIPIKGFPISVSGGSTMSDLNSEGTISVFGNTVNSLLYERNLMKLYQRDFISISASRRLMGLAVSGQIDWTNRTWRPNTNDFTIRDLDNRVFTSNNPFFPAADVPLFPENQALKVTVRATYEFSKKYVTYPNFRSYLPSKYPRIGVSYTKGIKSLLGSDVDYDLLSVDVTRQNVSLGLYGKFSFYAAAGKFLTHSSLFYTDYKHFSGNQTLRYQPKANGFLFLDYYTPSTSDRYLEGHLEHNFGGLFMSKLPLIRKLNLQERAGVNYLTTPGYKQYQEYYFGLEYLGIRAYYGFARQASSKADQGFRIVYGF